MFKLLDFVSSRGCRHVDELSKADMSFALHKLHEDNQRMLETIKRQGVLIDNAWKFSAWRNRTPSKHWYLRLMGF